MSFVNATSPWANKNCVMSVKKCGGQTAYHDHVHQANQNKSEGGKEDDVLTEGAYCSCTAGYEIYACFF
jgi:hypothetical protein